MNKELSTLYSWHPIALTSTNIVNLDAYELNPKDERSTTNLLINAWVLHYTYDRGSLLFKGIFIYLW